MKTRVYYVMMRLRKPQGCLRSCGRERKVIIRMAEKLIDKSNPWYRDDDESILEIYDVETGTRSVS